MRRLLAATVRFYRQHPAIWTVTLGGVTLGVAVIVAIDIATQSSDRALTLSLADLYGESTHQIGGGPDGISPAVYTDLRATLPNLAIAPVISGNARVDGLSLGVLGIDLLAEAAIRPRLAGVATGRSGAAPLPITAFLTTPDALAISRQTAERLALAAGDTVVLAVGRSEIRGSVVAVLERAPDNVLITDLANADRWLDRDGRLSRIDVKAVDTAIVDQRLVPALPSDVTVIPTQASADATLDMTRAFTINLTAMSLLAMLIGAFLIFNAISFAVVRRREQFAALRAFGLERRQVVWLVLIEVCAFALLGTLLGILFGALLGAELTSLVARTVNDLYFRVEVTETNVAALTLGKALALGLGFTLLAGLPAALEAARTQPRLALRRSSIESRVGFAVRGAALVGIAVAGCAAGLLAITDGELISGLTAVFMVIIGYALVLPALIVGVLRYLAVPIAAGIGRMSALTIGGIERSLSRTGVAIVALAVAVSATVGVSTMVGSFRQSVQSWLDSSLSADIYVGAAENVLSHDWVRTLAEVPGVDAVAATRRAWLSSAAGPVRLQALSLTGAEGDQQLIAGDPASAWRAFAAGEGIIVSEVFAYRRNLRVGDSYELPGANVGAFPIVAVYRSYDVTGGAILLSLRRYRELWADDRLDALALTINSESSRAAVIAALEALPSAAGQLFITNAGDLRTLSMQVFDRTFVITDVLYFIAVGIAVVGIIGALLALQLEQQWLFGTFRALGMTRLATGLMVLAQSAFIGLLAGLAAIPLGLIMARLLIDVVNRRAFGWTMGFDADIWVHISAVLVAVAAAVCGGLLPAIQAAQTRPAAALRGQR
ncbi:MAG: FtsX-like permease family protein [Pseudomonadota bacterium]